MPIGFHSTESPAWGTYLHGVFDADEFRRWFIDDLRQRKGLGCIGKVVFAYDVESALERLADVVEESVDMDAIMQLLGM